VAMAVYIRVLYIRLCPSSTLFSQKMAAVMYSKTPEQLQQVTQQNFKNQNYTLDTGCGNLWMTMNVKVKVKVKVKISMLQTVEAHRVARG
jgi:hypothetical protein